MGALSCSENLGSSLILDYSAYPTPVNPLIDNDEPTMEFAAAWTIIFGTYSFVVLGLMRLVPGRFELVYREEPFPKADFGGTMKELLEKVSDSAGEVPGEIVNEAASELSDIKYSSLLPPFCSLSSDTSLSQFPSIHSKKSKG
ncbi:hypothetical protein N7530_001962 [Penicillium desertorum]|uniref:Uncharacterized protein n=1 Tax=Penicillium desertorum TaxID=1303715 RepID=A0A9W9XB45_9EURO|nr:hypothetical protein N7530_001962 [Penicillium desertorum]